MKEQTKSINYQFKILYFIGIFFIVMGHCSGGGVSVLYEWFPLYSFHVPLWIFCSGYFYNVNSEKAMGKLIFRKIKRLLIPLLAWNLAYGIICSIMHQWGFAIGSEINLKALFVYPFTNGHQFMYNCPSWFIAPLFMIEICYPCIRKLLSIIKVHSEWIILVICLIIGLFGVKYSIITGNTTEWMRLISRLLVMFPFYGVGHFYKNVLEEKDKVSNWLYFGILVLVQLILVCKYKTIFTFSMAWCNDLNQGTLFTPYIVAITGIAFWLRVARILTPILKDSKIVNYVANNTFHIMMNHVLGFMVVKGVFALAYKYLHICQSFDINAFKTNLWYMYLPRQDGHFLIIYVFGGIIFSLICAWCITKSKKIVCNAYNVIRNRITLKSSENI